MGIWSNLRSLGGAIVSGGKKLIKKSVQIAKEIKDTVVATSKKIGKAMASGYKSFTGEKLVEEARALYDKLKLNFEQTQKEFETYAKKINSKIDNSMKQINTVRSSLKQNLFAKFIDLSSSFAEWEIDTSFAKEFAVSSNYKMNKIRNESDVFKIDFDKNPITSNLLALATLGFGSRKKAKDTLENVKNQEKIFEEEKLKLKAEKKRLELVSKSLANIANYFIKMESSYSKLLSELDYSVNLVKSTYSLLSFGYFGEKIDLYFLPKKHLDTLMAADKISRILHNMASQKYMSSNWQLRDTDINVAKNGYKNFQHLIAA